jgi:hypothetical protein
MGFGNTFLDEDAAVGGNEGLDPNRNTFLVPPLAAMKALSRV